MKGEQFLCFGKVLATQSAELELQGHLPCPLQPDSLLLCYRAGALASWPIGIGCEQLRGKRPKKSDPEAIYAIAEKEAEHEGSGPAHCAPAGAV